MKKSLMIFLFALGMCFSLTACNGWSDLFAPSENSSSVAEESSSEENSDSENSSSGTNEEERQNASTERRKFYEGLPVTTVSVLIPFLFCFKPLTNNVFSYFYLISLIVKATLLKSLP